MENFESKFKDLVRELHEEKKIEEISKIFRKIAEFLMNEVCIVAGENKYRIMECEFYYHSDTHKDPFVHAHDDEKNNKFAKQKQCKTGDWYFHDSGKGLDITIGNEHENINGGILIRGIKNINSNDTDPTVGPFKSCKELLNNFGSIFSNSISLELSEKICFGDKSFCTLYWINRKGIEKKTEDIDNVFFYKKYRYLNGKNYINHLNDRKANIVEMLFKDTQINCKEVVEILRYTPNYCNSK